MLELEERIVDALRAIGDDAEPSADLDGLVRRRTAQRARRRRVTLASTAGAAAIVLVAGAVGLWSRSRDDQLSVIADAQTPTLFLVPAQVPEGFTLTHAAGGDGSDPGDATIPDDGWVGTQRWVRMDGAGHPAEVVDVQWGSIVAVVDPLDGSTSSTPTTVRGHVGGLSESGAVLAWTEADGVSVAVTGTTAYPDDPAAGRAPLDPAVLTGFADALVARDGGGFDVATPPAGFELVGEVPGGASTGHNPRTLAYTGPGGRTVLIDVVDGSDIPAGMNLAWTAAQRVEVRGHDAVLSPGVMTPPALAGIALDPATDLFLQWQEPTGELVTLAGVGMTGTELVDLAGDLVEVDAATWLALQHPGEPSGGPAPTTTAPDSTVVTEPAPGAQQVSGTYSGTEHYAPVDGDCGIQSRLDAQFTLADGAVWSYHADYCGRIEDGDWISVTGDGAFTLPDGSTLTVRMPAQQVPSDSAGEPYDVTVTGGSGTFTDASGTCQLDNHLTDIAFGIQQQDGTFVCAITP
jgi:hypothetical protein